MNEWLTTGEMIDRLKVGETALCVSGDNQGAKVEYLFWPTEDDTVLSVHNSKTKKTKMFVIKEYLQNSKWRIISKYVSFEEAMKAFAHGKKIRCELLNQEEVFQYQMINGFFHYRNVKRGDDEMVRASNDSGIGIRCSLINHGYWSIEGDY